MRSSTVFIAALLCLSLAVVLGGCAAAPKPIGHRFTIQKKWQAAQHWSLLARDLAGDIASLTRDEGPLAGEAVYVKGNSDSDFDKAFTSLLITHLVNKEVTIAYIEGDNPTLTWSLQKVRHRADRESYTPFPGQVTAFALLGAGIYKLWDLNEGAAATIWSGVAGDAALQELASHGVNTSHIELVLTSTLWRQGDMALRQSNFYYINDEDHRHYRERPDYWEKPVTPETSRFQVVDGE